MLRPLLACLLIVSGAAVGCSSIAVDSSDETSIDSETSTAAANGQSFAVDAFGLTFSLPASFVSDDNENYAFFSTSLSPRSVFSIAADDRAVIDYLPRPGEKVTAIQLDGVNATVVLEAAIDGLPDGIGANELLVSNGDKSFTVIMSGEVDSLTQSWELFMSSVRLS